MVDYAKHRAVFSAKIAKIHQQSLPEPTAADKCEHEWQRFKESVRIENDEYKGQAPHFVVLACTKCKTKRRSEFVANNPQQ